MVLYMCHISSSTDWLDSIAWAITLLPASQTSLLLLVGVVGVLGLEEKETDERGDRGERPSSDPTFSQGRHNPLMALHDHSHHHPQ